MSLNAETRAALVFLILYFALFLILLFGYITRRIVFGSRYSIIFFHVTVRLASQATGVAFGVVGYSNTNLLVAYFILGAPCLSHIKTLPTS
jgi:cytochrome b561